MPTVVELYRGGWRGGTAAYLRTLLPALEGTGWHAVYAAPSGDEGHRVLAERGVETAVVPTAAALAAFVRRRGARVVHTHGVRMNLVGRAVARAGGAVQVVTVHSRLEQDYASRVRALAAAGLWGPGVGGAAAVVAVSEAVRQDLLRRGLPPARVHVVESGVEPPPPPWSRAEAARAFDLPADALVGGTVARLHPVKGLDALVDALALMARDASLGPYAHLFLGEGPEGARLRARAEAAGVGERVRWLGYRTDARAVVGAFDVFVLPSRAEGFGLAALEAMAAGVPVVATAVGNLPSLLDGGRLGVLVPVDDPPALAAAMADLLRDPRRRRELGEAGRARYARDYAPEAMAERTAAVFAAALGGRPAG
ncbi:MAG: glycosyltransferase family 4 protein [Firmicutes bacterium]|nr:glycosyltransferase family 4 protein [Bacillota bacterium]